MTDADARSELLSLSAESNAFRAITDIAIYTPDHPGLFSQLAGADCGFGRLDRGCQGVHHNRWFRARCVLGSGCRRRALWRCDAHRAAAPNHQQHAHRRDVSAHSPRQARGRPAQDRCLPHDPAGEFRQRRLCHRHRDRGGGAGPAGPALRCDAGDVRFQPFDFLLHRRHLWRARHRHFLCARRFRPQNHHPEKLASVQKIILTALEGA